MSVDLYNGVSINPEGLPGDKQIFSRALKQSLTMWKDDGRRGVWLRLPAEKIDFAHVALEHGFVMHHAEKEYLMLTHWLSEDENKLPPNASHQIGVGAVVVDDTGKILVVQEKSGPTKGLNFYKIPTGLVDVGEDLSVAACREVLEETGVSTEFLGIVGFRHMHRALFGKSDLVFLCLLKPTTTEIKIQEEELHLCEWKDIDEFVNQPILKKSPLNWEINKAIMRLVKRFTAGDTGNLAKQYVLPVGFRPGSHSVYILEDLVDIPVDLNKAR
jgi:ADP-ribose pyrophosphatase YjhB (NUDIX family)